MVPVFSAGSPEDNSLCPSARTPPHIPEEAVLLACCFGAHGHPRSPETTADVLGTVPALLFK